MGLNDREYAWEHREPIKGLAFLLNDSVAVVAGPNTGSRGFVVDLVGVEPEPQYRVQLKDGNTIQAPQSALLTSIATDPATALCRLQRWYSAQCDDDWEHQLGVSVETLDNPGWHVKIDLVDTPLADVPFHPIHATAYERKWIDCKVENGVFIGMGGPHMLGAIIEAFIRWAEGTAD